jgi:type II secretory pathway pseudopilin PulG
LFVRASVGSIRPSVVVNVMSVPFWTGVPEPVVGVDVGVVGVVGVPGVVGVVGVVGAGEVVPFSIAVTTISISPFNGTVVAVGKSVITVPPGASRGTLSHAEANRMSEIAKGNAARRGNRQCRDCASIRSAKDNILMGLRGQAERRGERGYAMAALLIALAIMAILLTVAMPVWRHEAQREKEAELVFRGEQYARAIALYKFKNAQVPNILPPSIDVLVTGRFLRKKYKDPMTKDGEFELVSMATQAQPGIPQSQPQRGGGGRGTLPSPLPTQPGQPGGGVAIGGIRGVRSKSQDNSIRTYRGATRYDQWMFTYDIAPRPGGAMPMANSPDGRGSNPPGGIGGPGGAGGPTRPGRNTNPPGGGGPRGGGPGSGAGPGGPPRFPPPQGGPPSGRGRGLQH